MTARRKRLLAWLSYPALLLLFPTLLVAWYLPYQPEIQDHVSVELPPMSHISPYDSIIIRHADRFKLDWRLVASMIFVESSFNRDAVSSAGAIGLMQIMPAVAREQAVDWAEHPEQNIRAGVAHFMKKLKRIKARSWSDQLKLSLAAYNAGLGHIRDAQRLAIEQGLSPRRWEDVSQMLVLLEIPEYHQKARYGYCQGRNAVEYVGRVMKKFGHYRNVYPRQPMQVSQAASTSIPRT